MSSSINIVLVHGAFCDGSIWSDVISLLQEANHRVLAAVQNPTNLNCFTEKSGPPAWRKLPSWYLVSEQDKSVNPDCQRWVAQRAGCVTSTIASSHASIISRPREVVDLILTAAQESVK